MYTAIVRNVNEALEKLRRDVDRPDSPEDCFEWHTRNSRAGEVIELDQPMTTLYERPTERVVFSRLRDANPFFHLFESLWILAGRRDVAFLALFNSRMSEYSDDGTVFHAPYGHRLRGYFGMDQIVTAHHMLSQDADSRRVALSIWDPVADLNAKTKDVPCNDMVFLKIRPQQQSTRLPREIGLSMTVMCRSNDAIWGAYGTNVVQFSMLQELLAQSLQVPVGEYRHISDSFHIYTDNEAWRRMRSISGNDENLQYEREEVSPFPLMDKRHSDLRTWLSQCELLCDEILVSKELSTDTYVDPFFRKVAIPMWKAWYLYKHYGVRKALDYTLASDFVESIDWHYAAAQWLVRRVR